jgi:hypothetical protein
MDLFFAMLSEGPPHLVAFYEKQEGTEVPKGLSLGLLFIHPIKWSIIKDKFGIST